MALGDTLGELNVKINADTGGLKKGLSDAEGMCKSGGGGMSRNLKLGIAGGVAAIAGIGTMAVKSAADFESAMREVNTMAGLSEEQFQNLSDQVLQQELSFGFHP